MRAILRALPLLFFLALLLDRHMVPHGATGHRAQDRMMVREVPGHAPDNGTFQAPGLGGRDTYTA
jgi:hypothetical protein